MIRPATPSDLRFVFGSWLGSFGQSPVAKSMTDAIYKSRWTRLIAHLCGARGDVVILCDDASPGVILAWACHDRAGTLHYVFTREDFRRLGHARALLASIAPRLRSYTARTLDWQEMSRAGATGSSWRYDPALAWFPELLAPKEQGNG